MKLFKVCLMVLSFAQGIAHGQTVNNEKAFAVLPQPKQGEKVATFAGGCFWSLSECFLELNGVNKVVAGYSGGAVKNPTYEDVCTRSTGHAESVQVYYNPAIISYAALAEAFFYAHDPTTLNRQGPDEGTDYRSIAFYHNPEEKKIIEQAIAKVNRTHHYEDPIVTQVLPFQVIYPAENYHQGYFRLHPDNPYIQQVSLPKVVKMRKMFNNELKPAYKQHI